MLAVTIISDGNQDMVLALTTPDGETIEVWDALEGRQLHRLPAQRSAIASVAITGEGLAADARATAIVAHYDHYLRVWALENIATSVVAVPAGQTLAMQLDGLAVDVSPDGRWAMVSTESAVIGVWDLESGKIVTANDAHEMIAQAVQAVRDARLAQIDHARSLIKQRHANIPGPLPSGNPPSLFGSDGEQFVGISEQSLRVPAATEARALTYISVPGKGSEAEEVGSPDLRYGLYLWDLPAPSTAPIALMGHSSRVMAVAMTPDGRRALSASQGRTVRVWDLDGGRELHVLRGHRGIVWDVQIAPNGELAVSASEDRTLRAWDVQHGRCVAVYTGDLPMRQCALRDDGRAVVGLDVLGRIHLLGLEGKGVS